jgi:hypothetical protein
MDLEDSGQWGIAELMGHKVVAGFLSKSDMLGAPLLRVDVPETSAYPAFTQMFGTSAIYCVTFTSEDVARRTAESTKVNPVSVYVPDLVTVEKFEEAKKRFEATITRYQEQIRDLRSLPAPEDDSQPERFPCPNCGRMCDDTQVTCMNCGYHLSGVQR